MNNDEPLTWACECGQMNLLNARNCVACDSIKDESWSDEDRRRAIIVEDSKGRKRIKGFRM